MISIFVFLLVSSSSYVLAGRVLLFPAFMNRGSEVQFTHLANALVEKGHDVTIWKLNIGQPYTSNVKLYAKVKEVTWDVRVLDHDLKSMFDTRNNSIYGMVFEPHVNEFTRKGGIMAMSARVCEMAVQRRAVEFSAFVKERYDVAIVDDQTTACSILWLGLTRTPFVYWSMTAMRPETAWSSMSPALPSFVPVPGTELTDDMNFQERIFNFVYYVKTIYQHRRVVLPVVDHHIRQALTFLPETPPHPLPEHEPTHNIERNASLNFINTLPLFDFPRPFMPRVIHVGCMQCKDDSTGYDEIPRELASFLAGATDGFVLFTTGYNVRWDLVPRNIVDKFLAVFHSLPRYRFVWQYNGPDLGEKPHNVFTMPWLPQTALLADRRCRALMTTGGTASLQEAINHGKPVLGVPVFWDQIDHLIRVAARGAGLIVAKANLTNEIVLRKAIERIVEEKSFTESAAEIQEVFTDVVIGPKEHAVKWIEFLMRFQEIPFARSGADDFNFLQYFLVDVFLVLGVLGALLCWMGWKAFWRCCTRTAGRVTVEKKRN